jgi:predicted MFS family arabinose efflux permease
MALAAVFSFLKNYVESAHVGTVGLFFTSYSSAAILLRVLFGWVPDRLGPLKVLYPSMICIASAMVVLAIAQHSPMVALAGVLAGLGHGYAFPILSALVVARANPADRGSAVALFTAVFDAGILIGSPTLGAVAEGFGYRSMYGVAGVLPLVGALVFFVWDRSVTSREPQRETGTG